MRPMCEGSSLCKHSQGQHHHEDLGWVKVGYLDALEWGEVAHAQGLDRVVPPHGSTNGTRAHHIDSCPSDVQIVQSFVSLQGQGQQR
jgi:hypothetical protein